VKHCLQRFQIDITKGKDVPDITRRKLIAVGFSFPLGYTPQQVSELLWSQIGLNVDPADITTKDTGTYSASAFISLTDDSLVDFLNRQFETCFLGNKETGAVHFEKKIWKEDRDGQPARRFRATVNQITIELPGPAPSKKTEQDGVEDWKQFADSVQPLGS
jgi:hypothetical protein